MRLVAAAILLLLQVIGASLSASVVYVLCCTALNLLLQVSLTGFGSISRVYWVAASAVSWGWLVRGLMWCEPSSVLEFARCASHPGGRVTATFMTTLTICFVHSMTSRDLLSRMLLRWGLSPNLLWPVFNVSSIANSLVAVNAKTIALLDSTRQSTGVPPLASRVAASVRQRVIVAASSVARIFTRYLYARDALQSRLRLVDDRPVFIQEDKWTWIEWLIVGCGVLSFTGALVFRG